MPRRMSVWPVAIHNPPLPWPPLRGIRAWLRGYFCRPLKMACSRNRLCHNDISGESARFLKPSAMRDGTSSYPIPVFESFEALNAHCRRPLRRPERPGRRLCGVP
jgi:hypothetical protein